MSESKKICPVCARPPGGTHDNQCPRSRESVGKLREACRAVVRPIWIFGSQIARTAAGEEKITFNPGIPYVRDKPWFAGGKPRDMKQKEEGFIKHMNRARKVLLAVKAKEKERENEDK